MTDAPEAASTQLVVNPDVLPAIIGTIARYAGALLAGWLIRRGYIGHADEALVGGLVLALTTAGYAVWRQYRKHAALVRAAVDPASPGVVLKGETLP